MFNRLRSLGTLGGHTATVLTFLTTNWALTMSTVAAAIVGFWDQATAFAGDPKTRSVILVFLAVLWTSIGVRVIIAQNRPRIVKTAHEYPYSVIIEGIAPIYNQGSADRAFSIAVNFRNVGAGPIRIRLEELRIVVGDRTLPDSPSPADMVLARLAARAYQSGGFKRDVLKGEMTGSLTFSVIYGPPDGNFIRRFKLRAKIHVVEAGADGKLGFGHDILEESDTAV